MGILADRRAKLHSMLVEREQAELILFPGHQPPPRNYMANVYQPFRQSSHFLYYFGIEHPGFVGALLPDGRSVLFGPQPTLDDIVWEGPLDALEVWGDRAETDLVRPIEELAEWLHEQTSDCLYLPPYQGEQILRMARWLGRSPDAICGGASTTLCEAVYAQRAIKSEAEIAEIERALSISAASYDELMRALRPGVSTASLMARVMRRAYEEGVDIAYPPIITSHGEILHAHGYHEILEDGRLLLVDMGLEAPSGYASDITRTMPINGRFSPSQRDVYEVVLASQLAAIDAMKPGVTYRDVHKVACQTIAEGLVALGLMKGDPTEAVAAGAHALFFPHGLGHALGLDVHDMEDLGDLVGYGGEGLRSKQFGLNFLRFARELEVGHVLTVEPGIYFVPALIELWQKEQRCAEWIAYDKLDAWKNFGGIRIEDDVLVSTAGVKVLGPAIPKQIKDLEDILGTL